MRFRQKLAVSLVAVVVVLLATSAFTGAHSADYRRWVPTRGYVTGYHNNSGPLQGYRSIDFWIMWETTSSCTTSSALYEFCSGQHSVFEHDVVMSNYQTVYPEEYRYAKWPEAYASNFPGAAYLDTQASDDETEENWTVGTLDAGEFEPYVQYYADIVSSPDYPGPNWWKLYFDIGVIEAPLCGITVSPEWCMLFPHDTHTRIPFQYHYTFPGGIYWYGQ